MHVKSKQLNSRYRTTKLIAPVVYTRILVALYNIPIIYIQLNVADLLKKTLPIRDNQKAGLIIMIV